MKSHKTLAVVLITFFATSFAFALVADETTSQNSASQDSGKTVDARIQELQSERNGLLQKRLDQLTKIHQHGKASLDTVLSAEYDLLNARLQSSATKLQRIKSMRQIIKNRMRVEESRALGVEQGMKPDEALLLARVETLAARIALLRELPPKNATVAEKD